MHSDQRRQAILDILSRASQPVSAGSLAQRFSVSRQIIVGDIALLRAAGALITATPRGYIVERGRGGLRRTVACIHSRPEGMERELNIMVDNGCTVIDVVVDHPLYGQMTGQLSLASRYDVRQFVEKAKHAAPLSSLTDGVHIHNLRCPSEEAYQRVCEDLKQLGILYTQGGTL